ncbi:antibiotic biosynthesis monooxygenase [Planctomycetota bacterium]|nr:antibiotic biosynthesis monooxygenase [Planctomycetota bacterium]
MHITEQLPYYAVIFTSNRTIDDESGYRRMNQRLETMVAKQPGFIGVETVRDDKGYGITISYWKDKKSIRAWREHTEHWIAQEKGKAKWYEWYRVQVCKVERAYSGGSNIPVAVSDDVKSNGDTDQGLVNGLEG